MDRIGKDVDVKKKAQLLRIGIAGACIILLGDLLMGWGVRDESLSGIAGQLSPCLSVSDARMFWASVCGFAGVPLAVMGHWAIYGMLKPYSKKCSFLYALGCLGFLAFGGAGVHVSSVEAAYFYKNMMEADPTSALDGTMKFAMMFLLPLYAVLITGWVIMVIAHMRAVVTGKSPFPRRAWVFAMPVGTLLFSLVGIFGNHALVNALAMGAFSMGNVWTLAGHLWMVKKIGAGSQIL